MRVDNNRIGGLRIGLGGATITRSTWLVGLLVAISCGSSPDSPDAATGDSDAAMGDSDAAVASCALGDEVRLAAVGSGAPSAAWTGSEFATVWGESGGDLYDRIYFARLDASGARIGDEVISHDSGGSDSSPTLIWTGSEYGLLWATGGLSFTRLSSSGEETGFHTQVASSAGPFSAVWNGDGYALAWKGASGGLSLTRLDSSGTKLGSDVSITDQATSWGRPPLAWSGSEYGVAWEQYVDDQLAVVFARLDPVGDKLGDEVPVSEAEVTGGPSLVWTGSEYGLTWSERRMVGSYVLYEICLVRFDAAGSRIGEVARVVSGHASNPTLSFTGSEYGLAWEDDRNNNGNAADPEIYFVRLNADGSPLGSEVRLTVDTANLDYEPSIVAAGGGFGVGWAKRGRAYFRALSCP